MPANTFVAGPTSGQFAGAGVGDSYPGPGGRDLNSDNTEFIELRLDQPLKFESDGVDSERDGWITATSEDQDVLSGLRRGPTGGIAGLRCIAFWPGRTTRLGRIRGEKQRAQSHGALMTTTFKKQPQVRAPSALTPLLRGYHCERKAGWDAHGLPVEHEVEKTLGIFDKRQIEKEVGIAQFVSLCRRSVTRYVSDWEAMTERMGFWVDLNGAYLTLHNSYIESVWYLLKQLWDRRLIYQGYKVVPYDPPSYRIV